MRLLVSVRNASEAAAALAGGADIIDAKEPLEGALGPVTSSVFREICETVGRARPISAALGDAGDGPSIEQAAREFAGAGAAFVKIGFADATRLDANLAAAVRGAGVACRVIGVAYVDANVDSALVLDAIERANGQGILLDTVNKTGPGLRQLISPSRLAHLVSRAHAAGLLMAAAGTLAADDLTFVSDAGVDVAGVRGAACVGGRGGRLAVERVRLLADALRGREQNADLVGGHAD
jgi:(5-formylfuran-3-yl)methyl phosphate synthase